MLCRLNQELFPDPGSPIAKTTTPLEARAAGAIGALVVEEGSSLVGINSGAACVSISGDSAETCKGGPA